MGQPSSSVGRSTLYTVKTPRLNIDEKGDKINQCLSLILGTISAYLYRVENPRYLIEYCISKLNTEEALAAAAKSQSENGVTEDTLHAENLNQATDPQDQLMSQEAFSSVKSIAEQADPLWMQKLLSKHYIQAEGDKFITRQLTPDEQQGCRRELSCMTDFDIIQMHFKNMGGGGGRTFTGTFSEIVMHSSTTLQSSANRENQLLLNLVNTIATVKSAIDILKFCREKKQGITIETESPRVHPPIVIAEQFGQLQQIPSSPSQRSQDRQTLSSKLTSSSSASMTGFPSIPLLPMDQVNAVAPAMSPRDLEDNVMLFERFVKDVILAMGILTTSIVEVQNDLIEALNEHYRALAWHDPTKCLSIASSYCIRLNQAFSSIEKYLIESIEDTKKQMLEAIKGLESHLSQSAQALHTWNTSSSPLIACLDNFTSTPLKTFDLETYKTSALCFPENLELYLQKLQTGELPLSDLPNLSLLMDESFTNLESLKSKLDEIKEEKSALSEFQAFMDQWKVFYDEVHKLHQKTSCYYELHYLLNQALEAIKTLSEEY